MEVWFLSVCHLSVQNPESCERILIKFSGNVGNGTMMRWIDFGDVQDYHLRLGICFLRVLLGGGLCSRVLVYLRMFVSIFQGQNGRDGCWNLLREDQSGLISAADRLLIFWLTVSRLISTFWLTQTAILLSEWGNPSLWIMYWSHIYKWPRRSCSMYGLVHQAQFFPPSSSNFDWLMIKQAVGATLWIKTR